MLNDVARRLYAEKFITFHLGTLTNVLASADTVFSTFVVPRNFKLRGVGVSWSTSDAAGAGLTAKVTTTAGVVLASSGAATPSATASGIVSNDANVDITKGQILAITLRGVADTNDFVGASVVVIVEPPPTEE
jgi:hypothetical protein